MKLSINQAISCRSSLAESEGQLIQLTQPPNWANTKSLNSNIIRFINKSEDPDLDLHCFHNMKSLAQSALIRSHTRVRERSGSVVECLTQDREVAG